MVDFTKFDQVLKVSGVRTSLYILHIAKPTQSSIPSLPYLQATDGLNPHNDI
jgi:hypothetical protein